MSAPRWTEEQLAEHRNRVMRTSTKNRVDYVPYKARRHRRGVMNRLETLFYNQLAEWKAAGEIVWFDFECQKFKLAEDAWYTPDFPALRANARQVVYEVKGFWREAARLRCKVMATRYPHVEVIAVKRNRRGEWEFEVFNAGVSIEPINAATVPHETSQGGES